MKYGILGGTFDPLHRGHLDVAEAARAALGLDRVVLVPARVPSHRETPHASAAHRFAMVALAVQPYTHLLVSDIEMDDETPAFTAVTLGRLAGRGLDSARTFFLTGADAFLDIGTWHNYPAVLNLAHFVVVSRPGQPAAALPDLLPDLAGRMRRVPCDVPHQPSILLVEAPTTAVSSTDVRRLAASGGAIGNLVPPAVAEYIVKHQLYSGHKSQGFA